MQRNWRHFRRTILVLSLCLIAGLAKPLLAQETQTTGSLTLARAVQMALDQNPVFRESSDEAEAARARLKQVQAGWFPRFDFHQDFTRGNNPVYVFGTKLTQRQFSATISS